MISIYLLLGLLFALGFIAVGYKKIDPTAEGASLRLRLVWLPAAVILWPLLLVKWINVKDRSADSKNRESGVDRA